MSLKLIRHAVTVVVSAGLPALLAFAAITSQTSSTPSPSFGANVGQFGIYAANTPYRLAAQTETQNATEPQPATVTTYDAKVFAPYVRSWLNADTGLEMIFTRDGIAHIEWGGTLPCGSTDYCNFRMTVRFTIVGHTSRLLRGAITWEDQYVIEQRTFKVGHSVKLTGNPYQGHLLFSTGEDDAVKMCRSLDDDWCHL